MVGPIRTPGAVPTCLTTTTASDYGQKSCLPHQMRLKSCPRTSWEELKKTPK